MFKVDRHGRTLLHAAGRHGFQNVFHKLEPFFAARELAGLRDGPKKKGLTAQQHLDKWDNCPICLDAVEEALEVRTNCDHRFHHKCLLDLLVLRAGPEERCPICRDSPYPDPYDYDSEEEAEPLVTVKEAIKSAKASRKNCKQTDRMLKTVTKWRNQRKDARARVRALYKRLAPLEDAI